MVSTLQSRTCNCPKQGRSKSAFRARVHIFFKVGITNHFELFHRRLRLTTLMTALVCIQKRVEVIRRNLQARQRRQMTQFSARSQQSWMLSARYSAHKIVPCEIEIEGQESCPRRWPVPKRSRRMYSHDNKNFHRNKSQKGVAVAATEGALAPTRDPKTSNRKSLLSDHA